MQSTDAARRTGRRLPYVRCEGVGSSTRLSVPGFPPIRATDEAPPLEDLAL